MPGMWERTLTSYTFTKSYSMAGWRLGCIVGPEALLEPLVQIQEHTASFVSPFIQMAGIAAMTGPQDHIEDWRAECAGLAKAVVDRLNAVEGVHCPLPQGATFVFPRFSRERTSVELAGLLVDQDSTDRCQAARPLRRVVIDPSNLDLPEAVGGA